MTLDDIFTNWSEDSKISKTELDDESLKIPLLHSKYLKFYTTERLTLHKLEAQYKSLFKLKSEYFSGSLDMDTIKENGWEPNPKLILKSDLNMHIEADADIQRLSLKIGLQREKVSTLDSILKTISNRGFQISNALNYMKLMNGI
jgi:Recombination, repair and ssDNA binding protein UvsY